ncbi:HD domain-containing protein [Gordonia sp. LSe1-13]|uniref:HD domain-containing protein n=1 Tax=Gordonia sesuvii TaxID=3116777 RepID=A0ABU7MAV7_9ACTN|nr:HD domain-containing protein [Gordonia sp. LSe1-13]
MKHTEGVVSKASALTGTVAVEDRPVLVAAAWLHDVGYAPQLVSTGFHPLDGARFLESIGWSEQICGLVAHHSGARFQAGPLGLADELRAYEFTEDAMTDALTVADQTSGPAGERLTLDDRMRNMLRRHGPGSTNARAHALREPYFRSASARVAARRLTEVSGIDYAALIAV